MELPWAVEIPADGGAGRARRPNADHMGWAAAFGAGTGTLPPPHLVHGKPLTRLGQLRKHGCVRGRGLRLAALEEAPFPVSARTHTHMHT